MMNINSSDILTLDNNNEYVVVSKIVYNESEYIYLVNINDNSILGKLFGYFFDN